jgi:beta-lactamase class A
VVRIVVPLVLAVVGSSAVGDDFGPRIEELEKQSGVRIGIVAMRSAGDRRVSNRADERFLPCSTFKLFAAAAVLKRVDEQAEQLERFVPYTEAQLLDYAPVTREHVHAGGMKVRDLCAAAVEQSDNTAGNLLLETIGGPAGLTKFWRSLGDNVTRLDRMEPELNTATSGDERNTTTPAAICADLQRLLTTNYLSATSRDLLEDWMTKCQTSAGMIRASVPDGWRIGDKTGRSGEGAANDIAILRPPHGEPMFLCIYTAGAKQPSETRNALIAETAKIALQAMQK